MFVACCVWVGCLFFVVSCFLCHVLWFLVLVACSFLLSVVFVMFGVFVVWFCVVCCFLCVF